MRYWRPITNQDLTITGLLGVSWLVLILLWAFADYSTAEYKIIPCSDDLCRVQYLTPLKSVCFAEFTTIPVPGVCGVDCPLDFQSDSQSRFQSTSQNTTLPCNFDKSTKCPVLICKKYTDIGLFFSLIGLSIIVVGASIGVVFMEFFAYHSRGKNSEIIADE